MDWIREVLRSDRYPYRRGQTCCQWMLRYINQFDSKAHPNLRWAKNMETFLFTLTTEGNVTAAPKGQALNALVFL